MAAQRHAEAVLALYQPERHSTQALSYGRPLQDLAPRWALR